MEQGVDQGVGARIKRLREEKEWSMAKLAVEADMSVSGVSMIENGKRNLTTTTLAKLARAFGVEVADLFPKGQAQLPLEDSGLMNQPAVGEWLQSQGHMSKEAFLSAAETLDLSLDENGFPRGIERASTELKRRRDGILDMLKDPDVQTALFGRAQTEGLTGDDWAREVFRPGKAARKLANEIRQEYMRREVSLANYSVRLFIEGVTNDYLAYDRGREYLDRRHQELLKLRTRALEERSNKSNKAHTKREMYHWLDEAYGGAA